MAGEVSFFFFVLRWRLVPDADEDCEDVVVEDLNFAERSDAGCFRFRPRMRMGVRSIGSYADVVTRQQSTKYMQCA